MIGTYINFEDRCFKLIENAYLDTFCSDQYHAFAININQTINSNGRLLVYLVVWDVKKDYLNIMESINDNSILCDWENPYTIEPLDLEYDVKLEKIYSIL